MSHDNYELPSIYNTRKLGNFGDSEDEEEERISSGGVAVIMSSSSSALPTRQRTAFRDVHVEDNRLAWLMLGTAFFTLLMTIVPVIADIPNISPWFTGDALWRFFDPLITLPLNLFIVTRADVMVTGKSNYWGALSEASVVWLLWCFGASIYTQFHGVHTAAALFKVLEQGPHIKREQTLTMDCVI